MSRFVRNKMVDYLNSIRNDWIYLSIDDRPVNTNYKQTILIWDICQQEFSHERTNVCHPATGKVKVKIDVWDTYDYTYDKFAKAYREQAGYTLN